MVLVERFTRNSEDTTCGTSTTVEDLESFEKPWSVAVEMKKTSDPLLELQPATRATGRCS